MDGLLDELHGLKVVQTHQVEAEAVQIVLFGPIGNAVDHVLAEHITLGSRIVAAAGSAGVGAGRSVAVVVVRNDLIEVAVCIIGVVVNNVHDDAHTGIMHGLNHLLILVDADFTVVRIGGVAAFHAVVVLGIIAPVEAVAGGLIHAGVVIGGLQMHMGDTQLLQIVHTNADAGAVLQARLGEGQILAGISRGSDLIGEVTDMDLPDHGIAVLFQSDGALAPIGGIGLIQIHHHTPVAIDTAGLGIGVNSLLGADGGGNGISIVNAMAAVVYGQFPDALFALGHIQLGISLAVIAGLEQIQDHLGSGGSPNLEGGGAAIDHGAQIITVVNVVLDEFIAVKDGGGNHDLFAVALDLHGVLLGRIQPLGQSDGTIGNALAQAGQIGDFELLAVFINLDLIQRIDLGSGSNVVLQRGERSHCHHADFMLDFQSNASIIAVILIVIAGNQVNNGLALGDHHEAVSIVILGSRAPLRAAGIGAVVPGNKADLSNGIGNVDNALDAVFTGINGIALACNIIIPDPEVGRVRITLVIPVEGDLIVAVFQLQREFVAARRRAGVFGAAGSIAGGRFVSRIVALIDAGREAQDHGNYQKHCNEFFHFNSSCFGLFHGIWYHYS